MRFWIVLSILLSLFMASEVVSLIRRKQAPDVGISKLRPDPPLSISPTELYHKHVGMLPNYAGHVPGCVFRFGKTYGNDTRDAKRWLRGDFST